MSASLRQRRSLPDSAFSSWSNIINDNNDTQQFQQIIRERRDEREDIQKKAFTKWINNQLATSNSTPIVQDLFQDLRDGVILLRLLEILTGNEYKREIGKMRVHHIGNVNKVIAVLGEYGIKLLSISSNDIVDGNPKLTLALIWSIIQYWQGKDVLKSVVSNPQQTNVEKFLLNWCQQQTKGYKGVVIKDFTTSWQDGLAFNALIHKFRPDLFDYEDILQNAAARNLEHAFNIAKNIFKIDRYLDVEDVLSEYPDKKSILMYVMCLFQQLPASHIVIEDKEKNGLSTTKISMNMRNSSKETKSPSPPNLTSKVSSMTSSTTSSSITESRTILQSSQLTAYQTNMERLVQWILKLEEQLDREENVSTNDLKRVKEQFQKHEDFMISLTRDQTQIGQVLEEGNRLLSSADTHLQSREENEIKEQMKILNRRWESLRTKALDRQSLLHKTLMKLQIDQIESFDAWLTQAEQNISKQLETLEQNSTGVDRQYRHLAQLQDELVAQQQITESLQNMVIVIDDSSNNSTDGPASKYTSAEIEAKLLNLSERWANICTFVQNRWIQLQEIKLELEQVQINQEKVNRWLTRKEDEVTKILAETNITDTDILMQQVHSIKKTESEIDDIRLSILTLDHSLKVLSTHYDSKTSILLKDLNETINSFDKRWQRLLENLDQCSTRLKKTHLNIETSVKTNIKPNSDTVEKTITTIVEETTVKKRKIDNDINLRRDYEISARKFIDWIDSIERILADRGTSSLKATERQEIVQEVKNKYTSYDDQFQNLIQTGHTITKQMKENNEDFTEHETSLKTLEQRWQTLFQQIQTCERDVKQFTLQTQFDEEYQALTNARNECQTWINSHQNTSLTGEMQVKIKSFQSYNERISKLRTIAEHIDAKATLRMDQLTRSWNETNTKLRELSKRVKLMPQPSESLGFGSPPSRLGGTSSIPLTPTRSRVAEHSSSSASSTTATTMTSSTGSSTIPNENGNLFTLTNIYTFGDNGQTTKSSATDKSRIHSFVEVFDSPTSPAPVEFGRIYSEKHSTTSTTRKTYATTPEIFDYDLSRIHHDSQSTNATSTKHISDTIGNSISPTSASALPVNFNDNQSKLLKWLEQIEQSLLNDKVRVVDLKAIDAKKKFYKNLLDQTLEQEQSIEQLNVTAREYYQKLPNDAGRRLQEELKNYKDRLYDVKMFLSERLAKYDRLEKTLSNFERSIDEVKNWIRNVQPRLNATDTSFTDARTLENQLGRNQVLQHEIREMQTTINRLNKDVVDLTQDADENLARHLREEMKELNESWSHIISSTKVFSKNIQDALKRNKVLHEDIQEIEDWIMDKEREAPADDGPIFYQEQLRERLDQYQKLQSELNVREHTVRNLVLQGRQDLNASSGGTPDLAQHLETLVSNWTNLQKKVDTKVGFYTDIYTLHEELKNILHQENVWLDALQNKVFSSSNNGADAEEISEELDTLERFVKTHSKSNYEKIFEIAERLQATKVSIPATNSQINQFRIRWEQLHDDAFKKIHTLNSQISDYQHVGHQITAMFEWMKHTDSILNARLKDDVYADDVPAEAEKLIVEFNQYEAFLRSVDDKIHALRSAAKTEAAKRLEQQLLLLRNQFLQLQNKFRQFQKPSDFEPKHAKMRQILNDIEHNIYTLEVRSDDPDVIHGQLENCLKLYRNLSEIKSDVEYVIRTGRGIVERKQIDEPSELTRQIDHLKTQYNALGAKVSASKNLLDSIERHLRKFRKEYSHIHEWFVKTDNEIRKIENKQVSKNTKEETDWIRATRNYIKKLEGNFETLKNLERTIEKEANRPLSSLHEKTLELKRQIDQLDRRLKDRSEIVEGQVRKLEDEYQKFIQIYQEIIIRLDKLEGLLADAERVIDFTKITYVQDELRNVRSQLDELLTLGQELVSKSEKYSKLVGPDIETISRKFEELQRRIRTIQETQEKRSKEQHHQQQQQQQHFSTTTTTMNNNTHDDHRDDLRREFYSEKKYNRVQRESRHRSPSESSDISTAHGVIDEEFKKKYLRCLAYMKLIERLYENHQESDDDMEITKRRLSRRDQTFRERPECEEIEQIIRETEERAYLIEKTDIEQATRIREKIGRLRECLNNLKFRSQQQHNDETIRCNERYEEHIKTTDRTVPREREFDSDFIYDIDDTRSVISEPAPQFNTKYRKTIHSLERYKTEDQSRYVPTNEEYHLQPLLRVRSLKAIDHRTLSAPSSPVLQARYRSHERSNAQYKKQSSNHQGYQENFQNSISKSASLPNGGFPVQAPASIPQQPVLVRERVIDRHVAERSTSRGESHRQQQQQENASMHARSSHASSGQTQTLNRAVPIRYETSNIGGNSASSSYRQANGYRHEQYPSYFYHEQYGGGGSGSSSLGGSYRQQVYPTQPVGPHPTRIVN